MSTAETQTFTADQDTLESYTNYWSIHSVKDDKPVSRGWAKSESEATVKMSEIKQDDEHPDDEYWVKRMTESEVEVLQAMGEIPTDNK